MKRSICSVLSIIMIFSMSVISNAASNEKSGEASTLESLLQTYKITVEDNTSNVPYEVLDIAIDYVKDENAGSKYKTMLTQRTASYPLSSMDLLEISLITSKSSNQGDFLKYYANSKIQVTYEDDSIIIATLPNENSAIPKANSYTKTSSTSRYSVVDACRQTFTAKGYFETGTKGNERYIDCTKVTTSVATEPGYGSFKLTNSRITRSNKYTVIGQGPLEIVWGKWQYTTSAPHAPARTDVLTVRSA